MKDITDNKPINGAYKPRKQGRHVWLLKNYHLKELLQYILVEWISIQNNEILSLATSKNKSLLSYSGYAENQALCAFEATDESVEITRTEE